MAKKINLGIIGLGFIGKVHLRNCLRLKSANVVAVADVSKKALKYARELGVKRLFTDYHELLKQPDVDAVVISLPTYLHAPCAIGAAEEGKHIFLEKPLARNPEEGKKIISATRKHNVKLMIGYPLRYLIDIINLKKRIEDGELGDIQTAYAVNIGVGPFTHRAEGTIPSPVPEWWMNKESTGGGALLDLGSHMVNLLRWYLGEIRDIKVFIGYRYNLDVEDYAISIVNFISGTTATIDVGWFSQETAISIELHGTVGHASVVHRSQNRVITAIKLILGKTSKFFKPYLEELSHFVDCIKRDDDPLTSGDDALRDLEIIARAYNNSLILTNQNDYSPISS